MTSQIGRNRNTATLAAMIPEPSPNRPAPTTAQQTTSPVTRSELRAKQKFQQNRFLIIVAGALVVALLLFVAVSMPHQGPRKDRKAKLSAIKASLSRTSPRPTDEVCCRSPTPAGP
jgi:hypothetical protein